MQSLYGMKPGEVDMYLGANRSGRDLAYGQQSTTYDARMANNPQRDWASTIGQFAGAAGGAMTGLGALGFGKQAAKVASDRSLKTDIQEVDLSNIIDKFRTLPIYTWRYKNDLEQLHLGPMAQDMKEIFGVGDGKTIALVDVMGLLMLLGKVVTHDA
jgi:hypothetical protein